ncbi:23S ribosomal RNA methyltransferase Erm [Knoellia koreensis]|uniref:23S ribosomal RNA methyltransferase Erm n=1 Tax=Knoellia koreensis TaxID=2730921 RepID=A0A849HNG8_9MICO|nr:23S ribosomal RNA methyltransferase Erm [Knoellia sp. DB2414S]
MPTHHHGRHEHGQNFLTDRTTIRQIVDLVRTTDGPIIEIGPGRGAITRDLIRLGRPLTAVEVDARLAARLHRELGRAVTIRHGDFLDFRLPTTSHVIVGNLPFHQTTAILRRILHGPAWTEAILLVQWEVARRRAGVGASTMMTAQWAPWFDFDLICRVPARAFTPRPGVDGGLMMIRRQANPLVSQQDRRKFQALVHRVYTGSGRGLGQVLSRTTTLGSPRHATDWLRSHGLSPHALPGSMGRSAWVDLFKTTRASPPGRGRR